MKTVLFLSVLTILAITVKSQHFIPIPSKVNLGPKADYQLQLTEKINISDPVLQNEALELQKILKQRTNCKSIISITHSPVKQNFHLYLDTTIHNTEGYILRITPKYIRISAGTSTGIFYGIQTLDQLLLGTNKQSLPCLTIEDAPRYQYRALLLDPARHFIPLKEVKHFIDLMARFKFNALQLHLTDDQGWRIEIKKYPLLTSNSGSGNLKNTKQSPDKDYYTQDEITDLIAYAQQKHMEVIPELDIPGHTAAAIYTYPYLGCSCMDSIPVVLGQTTDRTLCAAKENVYDFFAGVLQEVCALFPSRRIHLGGDEAVIDKNWGHCPDCKKLMKTHGLRNTREIMGYFFTRIHHMVQQNNKELMLWCELDHIQMPANDFLFPYPDDCTLFTWRMGLTPKTIELTGQAGIKLVASPGEHCYFDYPQYQGDLPEFNNWGMPTLTLQQAYEWDPGYGLPLEKQKHIIGVAGLLWGEAMQNIQRITYMAYPRALALAEAGWSSMENRNWEKFKENLPPILSDLMLAGVSFRVPFEIYNP